MHPFKHYQVFRHDPFNIMQPLLAFVQAKEPTQKYYRASLLAGPLLLFAILPLGL
jgi:hypothetical protein